MYGLTDYEVAKEITRIAAPDTAADMESLPSYTPIALLSRLLTRIRQIGLEADTPCVEAQPALADCE
jgi:hypothetical protein